MLTNDDIKLLEKYSKADPEFKTILDKLNTEYAFRLSAISHELRNPITLLNSSLQLIQFQHPEVKEFKFWDSVIEEMEYLCQLLDDLSDSAKNHTLNIAPVNLKDIISSVCNFIKADAVTYNNVLNCHFEDNLPLVNADAGKLKQAILIILKNARDASPDEKVQIDIKIKSIENNFIQIQIHDNGCGIPDEIRDFIFMPFVSCKNDGNGIGLPLAKAIIDSHKGNLYFESKLNHGTTFFIELPTIQA